MHALLMYQREFVPHHILYMTTGSAAVLASEAQGCSKGEEEAGSRLYTQPREPP